MAERSCRLNPVSDIENLAVLTRFTLPQILWRQAEGPIDGHPAIKEKRLGHWETYSTRQYLHYTRRIALGFIALGVRRGEKIAILLSNQSEWLFCTLAAQALGCTSVSLPSGPLSNGTLECLRRTHVSLLVASGYGGIDRLLLYRKDLTSLKRVIYVDPSLTHPYWDNPWLIGLAEVIEMGGEIDTTQPDLFIKELWEGKPDDQASLILRDSAGAVPPLVPVTHRGLIVPAAAWLKAIPWLSGANWASFEPAPSSVEQFWSLAVATCAGMLIHFPETPETLAEDLGLIHPDVIVARSTFWQEFAAQIRLAVEGGTPVLRRLHALNLALNAGDPETASFGRTSSLKTVLRWTLRHLLCGPLKARTGLAACRAAYTHGTPLKRQTLDFLRAYGIPLREMRGHPLEDGYGMPC